MSEPFPERELQPSIPIDAPASVYEQLPPPQLPVAHHAPQSDRSFFAQLWSALGLAFAAISAVVLLVIVCMVGWNNTKLSMAVTNQSSALLADREVAQSQEQRLLAMEQELRSANNEVKSLSTSLQGLSAKLSAAGQIKSGTVPAVTDKEASESAGEAVEYIYYQPESAYARWYWSLMSMLHRMPNIRGAF